MLYAARLSAPLILGVGTGENFVASDIPAFLPYTRDVVFLEDGELVRLDAHSWKVMRIADLSAVDKPVHHIQWDMQAAQKGGYKHFMLKEIFEQPKVVTDCLAGRVDWAREEVTLPELAALPVPKRLHIVACGTSLHAGMWGKHLLESWAKVPVSVEIASEFRYRDILLDPEDMVLVISQSGETADTLAGLRIAREKGVKVAGLCNVVGSSIAREADAVIYTQAGPRNQRGIHQGHVQPDGAAHPAGPLLGPPQGHARRRCAPRGPLRPAQATGATRECAPRHA